jgi:hypothetical protein
MAILCCIAFREKMKKDMGASTCKHEIHITAALSANTLANNVIMEEDYEQLQSSSFASFIFRDESPPRHHLHGSRVKVGYYLIFTLLASIMQLFAICDALAKIIILKVAVVQEGVSPGRLGKLFTNENLRDDDCNYFCCNGLHRSDLKSTPNSDDCCCCSCGDE